MTYAIPQAAVISVWASVLERSDFRVTATNSHQYRGDVKLLEKILE
jgi:hypothetical protein